MKKLAFMVMMAMVAMNFAACGNSTKASEGVNDSDSVAVDTVVVDSVDTVSVDSIIAE